MSTSTAIAEWLLGRVSGRQGPHAFPDRTFQTPLATARIRMRVSLRDSARWKRTVTTDAG